MLHHLTSANLDLSTSTTLRLQMLHPLVDPNNEQELEPIAKVAIVVVEVNYLYRILNLDLMVHHRISLDFSRSQDRF